MDVQDLFKDIKDITTIELERRIHKLVRENFRYKNLDSSNQEIVFDLIKKYRRYLIERREIPRNNIRDELHKLYLDRVKLNLTEEDLKDIKEILLMFKK